MKHKISLSARPIIFVRLYVPSQRASEVESGQMKFTEVNS